MRSVPDDVKERWRIARQKGRVTAAYHPIAQVLIALVQVRVVLTIAKNTHSRHLHREETIEQKVAEPEQDREDKEFSHTAMG